MSFDADYFERGEELGLSCYTNYRWMPELTIPMAHEIVTQLGIHRFHKILDFGCAKGFLVKALRLLHYEAWGMDVSEYAVNAAPEDVREFLYCDKIPNKRYDWVISKDVLEHVPYADISGVLREIQQHTTRAFMIVPLGDGDKFNAPEYELDATHVIRENLTWWSAMFNRAGFDVAVSQLEMPFVKVSRCADSDAFFILQSRRSR